MKLDQEKRQFNDVLGYLHREIFTCEVHLKQVEKDLVGASKVMQVKRATRRPVRCLQLVSVSRCRGLFLCRLRGRSDRVGTATAVESRLGPNRLKFGPETTHRLL